MNCPSHFSFLKLTHWSKWVFTLFLRDKRSFHYIFYQGHGYAWLYILQPRIFELIDQWHFAVVLCDANFNYRSWQKALFSKCSHLPHPIWGSDLLWGCSSPHDHLKDDILSRPSSVVSMGDCRQRSGQLFPVSICAGRCLHCHTNCTLPLLFAPSLPVSLSIFLCVVSSCTCSQIHRGKYIE